MIFNFLCVAGKIFFYHLGAALPNNGESGWGLLVIYEQLLDVGNGLTYGDTYAGIAGLASIRFLYRDVGT